jgi:hypothetical protein
MRELSDTEAERLGEHPTAGPLSVATIFERYVVGHIEDHVEQLNRILADTGR